MCWSRIDWTQSQNGRNGRIQFVVLEIYIVETFVYGVHLVSKSLIYKSWFDLFNNKWTLKYVVHICYFIIIIINNEYHFSNKN